MKKIRNCILNFIQIKKLIANTIILTTGIVSTNCYSTSLEDYRSSCINGASITSNYLNKNSGSDWERIKNRCIGGTSRTLEAYEREKNKKVYGCGVGMGVVANFYDRKDILRDKSATLSILKECIK